MFAKEPPKKEKKLDSSEKVKNSGFTSTRWHEQAEKQSANESQSNGFTQTRWHDKGESQYTKRDDAEMSRASIFSGKSVQS